MSLPLSASDALALIASERNSSKANEMRALHKVERTYLGVSNAVLDERARDWRRASPLSARIALAQELWATNIHEARVLAAKLLTQARMKPDEAVWALICNWVPECDGWALADHVCTAGQKRLVATPARLAEISAWAASEQLWTRWATLAITAPFTRARHPKPVELEAREEVLGWASVYLDQPEPILHKAVAAWLRDLAKRDPDRVRAFLEKHGKRMQGAARREAMKNLPRTLS